MNNQINKDDVFKFASNVNIGYIIGFHRFILDELKKREDDLSYTIANFEGKHEDEIGILIERNLYASIFKHQMIFSTFLLLYSHLEEWLYLIWKMYGNSIKLDSNNKGSISRFKPIIQSALSIELSADRKWQFLVEAETVRNCLLHANARIDLSTKRKMLVSIIKASSGSLYENNSRLYMNQKYLDDFVECIQYLISKVESYDKT